MYVFRIKRISDNKYFKGKSKFTKNGTFLSQPQLEHTLPWVRKLSHINNEELSISIYNTDFILDINLKDDMSIEDIEYLLNRDKNLRKIINE